MKYYSLLFILFSTVALSAQKNPETSKVIQVSGIVLDKDNGVPLEYATLILQSVENPSQVTGGITDQNGRFNVEAKNRRLQHKG